MSQHTGRTRPYRALRGSRHSVALMVQRMNRPRADRTTDDHRTRVLRWYGIFLYLSRYCFAPRAQAYCHC